MGEQDVKIIFQIGYLTRKLEESGLVDYMNTDDIVLNYMLSKIEFMEYNAKNQDYSLDRNVHDFYRKKLKEWYPAFREC